MAVTLSEEQEKLIKAVARENGFTGDFEVDASPGSAKGDNNLGIITRVTIKNDERKLELILKSASTSEAYRKLISIHKVFCREIYIYETIFEEFRKFQEEYNITNPFSGYAKLYRSTANDGNEHLVMENMVENGCKLWNRKVPMNSEHITAVFVEYAKFHAVSLAMRHKKPNLFKNLTEEIEKEVLWVDVNDISQLEEFGNVIIKNGSKALEDDPEMMKVLKKLGASLPHYYTKEIEKPKWNLVINHSDCWCNNLMFKYETLENTTKISKVCILDWQLAKIGSPAADLAYFFFAHSPKEVLYDYQTYLKIYHDTLCQNLREFSCDPEEIFPYSLLEEHWRNFVSYGVYMSMTIIKMMYSDSDEALDFTELSESGKDIMFSLSFETRNADGYNERVKNLLRFVVDTGLLT